MRRVALVASLVAFACGPEVSTKRTVVSAPPAAPPAGTSGGDAGAPFDLVLEDAPSGGWSGANGNIVTFRRNRRIFGIWGASGHVFATSENLILHSADRGLHWIATATTMRGQVHIWGSSIGDVYVYSGTILHSTDRGATWSPVPAPGAVRSIWGSAPDDVYAVGEAPDNQGDCIWHTRDQGRTWSTAQPELGARYHLLAASGTGPNDVWVAGEGHKESSTIPILARSTDGGKTWAPVATPITAMTERREGIRAFCVSSRALLIGNEWGAFVSAAPPATEKSWTRVASGSGMALACSGHELLVGGQPNQRSVDDGATWTPIDLAAFLKDPPRSYILAAFISDTGEAYLGGSGSAFGTEGTLVRRAR